MQDLKTVGERLGWAIEKRPAIGKQRGLRKFQRDIEKRAAELWEAEKIKIPGVSMLSIMKYLKDDVTPSVAFLREAAQLAGVRPEWLAFGSGLRSEDEEKWVKETPDEVLQALGEMALGTEGLYRGIQEKFPSFLDLPHHARETVWAMFTRLRGLPDTDSPKALGRQLGSYLSAPFRLLPVRPEDLGPVEWTVFIEALARPIQVGTDPTVLARGASVNASDG